MGNFIERAVPRPRLALFRPCSTHTPSPTSFPSNLPATRFEPRSTQHSTVFPTVSTHSRGIMLMAIPSSVRSTKSRLMANRVIHINLLQRNPICWKDNSYQFASVARGWFAESEKRFSLSLSRCDVFIRWICCFIYRTRVCVCFSNKFQVGKGDRWKLLLRRGWHAVYTHRCVFI